MKAFAQLYQRLDASTSTDAKLRALADYLRTAEPRDAAWAMYFLAGGKPRQAVPTREMRELACQLAGIPDWLFEAGYAVTGDLAEAIAYVLPPPTHTAGGSLADWIEQRIAPLRALDPTSRRERLRDDWAGLDAEQRFLYVKLVGGGFRVGVSKLLVQRALAAHAGLDAKQVAQRMMGYLDASSPPSVARYQALIAPESSDAQQGGQPYPFFLAHPLEQPAEQLGEPADWLAEWKYDGIRAQLVRRDGRLWVWSRGEELVSERYPELLARGARWPEGLVLDGELLVWRPGEPRPEPFALLQKRIGRLRPGPKLLAEAPVDFVAYDLLELDGEDLREQPLQARRARLEQLAPELGLRLSPLLQGDWAQLAAQRAQAREQRAEGLMLKQRDSRYGLGRSKRDGLWWKWKLEPYRCDAVLIYAQAGHGRRANLYTDYSFAVWNRPPASEEELQAAVNRSRPPEPGELQLVPFAKAYSGLSDAEMKDVDRLIRKTTVEQFGPVRRVRPTLVVELGFEGLQRSSRHKSGIATRFPRMLRLRPDKPLAEADTLATLEALLHEAGDAG